MQRPNIVLIMVDDMGYSDLGCYGSEIATPNLDGLAYGGLRFSRFYNAARCCPTRASLLTGLYPHQAGMGRMVSGNGPGPYQGYINDRCVTIAEVLGSAGYATYMSGKWHIGEERPNWPVDRGFSRHYGLISGAMNYFDIRKSKREGVVRHFADDDREHVPEPGDFYSTDAFTDHAVQYIEEHDEPDRPFFLYLGYNAPHWPLHAWPEDIARYEGKYDEGWDALRKARYERLLELGLIKEEWALSPRDADAADWDELDDETKALMARKMEIYAAQVGRMDQGVGKVVDALKAKGVLENTLIMFLSDNGACHEGGPLGFDRDNGAGGELGGVDSYQSYGLSWSNASNTPFRKHKHWVHEGGIATPLIVYWPGHTTDAGAVTDQPGHIIDMMATCCEVAGAQYPAEFKGTSITPLEGKSLAPVFDGKEREPHEILHWEHCRNEAVISGKWKLVLEKGQPWELYDLEADRTELNDLVEKEPGKVKELEAKFLEWAERVGVRRE